MVFSVMVVSIPATDSGTTCATASTWESTFTSLTITFWPATVSVRVPPPRVPVKYRTATRIIATMIPPTTPPAMAAGTWDPLFGLSLFSYIFLSPRLILDESSATVHKFHCCFFGLQPPVTNLLQAVCLLPPVSVQWSGMPEGDSCFPH